MRCARPTREDSPALYAGGGRGTESAAKAFARSRLVSTLSNALVGLRRALFLCRGAHHLLSQPDGDARLAQRGLFAKVAAEWKALPDEQKEVRATNPTPSRRRAMHDLHVRRRASPACLRVPRARTQAFNTRAKTAKSTSASGDALEEGAAAAADGDAPSDEQAKKSDQDDGAEAKKKKKKKKKDEDGASGAEDGEKKARPWGGA